MAINVATLKTATDAVSDLIEAEIATDAAYVAMAVAVRADLATRLELTRLARNVDKLARAVGVGPDYQPVINPIV
jgi:hypothetical protein